MSVLLRLSRSIDAITTAVGKASIWLVLAAVVISAGNAVIRKALDTSSNAWLEVQWYLFGAVFMLAAAYTLRRNEHVRIDFISVKYTPRMRDLVDLFGHLFFLLPFCILLLWLSVPWFWNSFQNGEVSANAGGLVLWPAKLLVPLGFGLLTLQTFSEIARRILSLNGKLPQEPGFNGEERADD